MKAMHPGAVVTLLAVFGLVLAACGDESLSQRDTGGEVDPGDSDPDGGDSASGGGGSFGDAGGSAHPGLEDGATDPSGQSGDGGAASGAADGNDVATPGDDDDTAADDDASGDDDDSGDDDSWGEGDASDDDMAADDDATGGGGTGAPPGLVDDDDGVTTGGDDLVEVPEPEKDCPVDPKKFYISADDSNSQSSPAMLREYIEKGSWIDLTAANIRTYEFLNYYDVTYEPAAAGELRVVPQLRPDPANAGGYKMQIGVQAPAMSKFDRPLLNIVFSLDTSGSMDGRGIELEKEVLRALAHQFKPGDLVSIVQWSSTSSVILDSYKVDGQDDAIFLATVSGLRSGGSTDLHSGLTKAYEIARKNFSKNRLNRVVLVSDGGANTGVTDIDAIAAAAEGNEDQAIFMVGVGAGDYYNDTLMDQVTDAGKGAAMYIDSAAEAERMFHEKFIQNMMVAAADVRVALTLPPGWDVIKFHGEQISSDPREVEPQHVAPNDAMIFSQIVAACDPAHVSGSETFTVNVEFTDLATRERKALAAEATLDELLAADASQLLKGNAVVAYAEAAKLILGSYWSGSDESAAKCQEFVDASEAALAALPGDAALAEVDRLGRQLCRAVSGN